MKESYLSGKTQKRGKTTTKKDQTSCMKKKKRENGKAASNSPVAKKKKEEVRRFKGHLPVLLLLFRLRKQLTDVCMFCAESCIKK